MRYLLWFCWFAAIVYATIPSWWLAIHPFADRWRSWRKSPYRALLPLWVGMWVAAGAATWPWHALRLYRTPWAWLPALALLAVTFTIYRRERREFGVEKYSGQVEMRPKEFRQELVTTGLHARLRHPIYVAHLCGITGWTVGSGLAADYALLLFAVVTGVVMIRLEERELERRFGDEWRAYRRSVNAMIPRFAAQAGRLKKQDQNTFEAKQR